MAAIAIETMPRRPMRWLALLVAISLAGCGPAAGHPSSSAQKPVAPAVDGCVSPGPGARVLTLHPAAGRSIQAVLMGAGATTFVLTDESDENLCSWLPFVATLRAHGYSALLYDYFDPTQLPAEIRACVAAVRTAGSRGIILMGASVGARGSIEAAASRPSGVAAVISLSAEQTVASDPTDLVRVAKHVTTPTLLISARDDPFVSGVTKPLLRALASRRKRALILPGGDHGTSLLGDGHGPLVQRTILEFVAGI